jgi:hypothetical protein
MIITRTNRIDGQENSMDIPSLTVEQFTIGELERDQGALIQNVYPQLNADEREFLITGITPELWTKIFGSSE